MIKSRNIADGTILGSNMADGAIAASQLDLSAITVTVAAGETVGTETITEGATILGFTPALQDQMLTSIAASGTTLTVTLSAAATTDNSYIVQTI